MLGPLSPSFELVKNLRQALDKFLPDNAHEIASGRLHISLTRVSDKQNILVSEFSDKNDLMDVSRCCVLFLCRPHLAVSIVHPYGSAIWLLHQPYTQIE